MGQRRRTVPPQPALNGRSCPVDAKLRGPLLPVFSHRLSCSLSSMPGSQKSTGCFQGVFSAPWDGMELGPRVWGLPSLQGPSRLRRRLGQQCDYHPLAEPFPHPLLQPEGRLGLEPGGDTAAPPQASHTPWQPRCAHAWGLLFLARGPGLAEPAGDWGGCLLTSRTYPPPTHTFVPWQPL